MKRNSLTALFIVMAFASCTIDNDEAGYAYDQEEATNFEDAISSVVGTLDLGATIHKALIVEFASERLWK